MGPVVLDCCKVCGSIWSDQGEVNFIEARDLKPLENLLPQKQTTFPNREFRCPKDRRVLEVFQGESIPLELTIFHCQVCGGALFTSGKLVEFKKAQEAKVNYLKTWHIPLPSVYAVLLPLLLVLLIGGGLVATIGSFRQDTEVRTQAKDAFSRPLVYFPSPNVVQIHFTTSKNAATKIRYWTDPAEKKELWVSQTRRTTHSITLENLEDNQTYSYQLIMTEPELVASPIFTLIVYNSQKIRP